MTGLRKGWWPVFAFVYPLFVWPEPFIGTIGHNYIPYQYFTLFFVIGGVLLIQPYLKEKGRTEGRYFLFRHSAVVLVLVFGGWLLVASLAAEHPTISLTGALGGPFESALSTLLLLGVYILAYFSVQADKTVGRYIVYAVVASGSLLAVLGLLEVVIHTGLLFPYDAVDVPSVTFPQRGHLAGFFALSVGVSLGLFRRGGKFFLLAVFVGSLGAGLAINRAFLVALLGTLLLLLRKPKLFVLAAPLSVVGFAAGGVITKALTPTNERTVTSSVAATARFDYWQIALDGIAARPVFGWGAGQFHYFWHEVASPETLKAWWLHEKFVELESVVDNSDFDPLFSIKDANGASSLMALDGWKAHNQYLDIALMWGLVGLALYLGILWTALQGLKHNVAAAYGVLAYHLFLLFWFVPLQVLGVLWLLLAVAAGEARSARRSLEPQTSLPLPLRPTETPI